jgi:hypothetical protein
MATRSRQGVGTGSVLLLMAAFFGCVGETDTVKTKRGDSAGALAPDCGIVATPWSFGDEREDNDPASAVPGAHSLRPVSFAFSGYTAAAGVSFEPSHGIAIPSPDAPDVTVVSLARWLAGCPAEEPLLHAAQEAVADLHSEAIALALAAPADLQESPPAELSVHGEAPVAEDAVSSYDGNFCDRWDRFSCYPAPFSVDRASLTR